MAHVGVTSGYLTPTGFYRLTRFQRDPWDRGVTIRIERSYHLTRKQRNPPSLKVTNSSSNIISTVSLEYYNEGIVGAPLLASPTDTLEGKVEG